MLAQFRVSELVETGAGAIAHRPNVCPAIVPETENPLRPRSVDLVDPSVAYELSSHLYPLVDRWGGKRLVNTLLINYGEERLLGARTLFGH